jgi:hypothetical protein
VDTGVLSVLIRFLEAHSAAISLPLFVIAIAVAYWWYGLMPYRRDRPCEIRSPEHICRPAIPGVLEYLTTGWPETPVPTDPPSVIDQPTSTGTNQRP